MDRHPAPRNRTSCVGRWFLVPGFLAALWAMSVHAQVAPPDRDPLRRGNTPNVVLIMGTDMGWGDWGCYGQTQMRTPHLDRLAAEGVRFTAAYAGSPWELTSRASLLTGRDGGHVRVPPGGQVPLEPSDVTLAEVVRTARYPSAFIGAWGLGWENTPGHPLRQGFTEFFGFLEARDSRNNFPQQLWRNEETFVLEGNLSGLQGNYAPDWFTRATTNTLKLWRSQPFLVVLSQPLIQANVHASPPVMQPPPAPRHPVDPLWPPQEQAKAAMMAHFDASVGIILKCLRDMLLDRDTVVIVTSVSGPHADAGVRPGFHGSTGPYRGHKGSLSEGGLRVPLLIRWPDGIPAGRVVDEPVALWDILPTVGEWTRSSRPRNLDGLSLTRWIRGLDMEEGEDVPPRHLYWEWPGEPEDYRQAVRHGPWKALRNGLDQAMELYHLGTDPGENIDVAALHPEIVQGLREYLDGRVRTGTPDTDPLPEAPLPYWIRGTSAKEGTVPADSKAAR